MAGKINYSNLYNPGSVDSTDGSHFEGRLRDLRSGPALECHNIVDGVAVTRGTYVEREDPCNPNRVASIAFQADAALIEEAVRVGKRASSEWARVPLDARCETMLGAAARLAKRRIDLAALMSYEIGKTRADTLAEVDECIVILELFAEQMQSNNGYDVQLRAPSPRAHTGVVYRPYGLFGVISPFNFPMALAPGMAAGALITGNSVILKPSALTPATGVAWAEVFADLLPQGVLQVIHGDAEVGQALAKSDLDGLAFTGSAAVGLQLAQQMSRPPYMRPLVAEMGGKNPSVVTSQVDDIEMAARATARSAFGMTGQKCVACSRVIVHEAVYGDFVQALVAVTEEMAVGDPVDEGVFAGPLVRRASQERFEQHVSSARRDGRVLTGGATRLGGWYAELTVVDRLPDGHSLTRDELFVPLLAVTAAKSLEHAIAEANAVDYGLSAGIFTADPAEQKEFLDRIEAGIVFVNNPGGATTGVWPGSQTMAGWKASGSTGKGGFGPNYLQQFMHEQSRTIYPSLA
jgi:1-pyrroline-5-carboxylate dehydrogenase